MRGRKSQLQGIRRSTQEGWLLGRATTSSGMWLTPGEGLREREETALPKERQRRSRAQLQTMILESRGPGATRLTRPPR